MIIYYYDNIIILSGEHSVNILCLQKYHDKNVLIFM